MRFVKTSLHTYGAGLKVISAEMQHYNSSSRMICRIGVVLFLRLFQVRCKHYDLVIQQNDSKNRCFPGLKVTSGEMQTLR